MNLISINIDGRDYQVDASLNLVDAAHSLGIEIPHYCYHPKLPMAGTCRMCLVEIGMPMKDRATGAPVLNEDGSPKIGWMPKPAIACGTKVSPNLHVKLNSPIVKSCREGVTEFLLANHPLDCPICDQAGECTLQAFSADYGKAKSRYRDDKNIKPKHKSIGPRVLLDNERCILCGRCVRFCRDILKKPMLGITQRGSLNRIDCFPGMQLDGNYSMNVVDVCPVGAMTSKDFRFKMRVWFLKKTNSICTESSTGVNTIVWSREGVIYRITPRENDDVNIAWMTDSGRMLYKDVLAEDRLYGCRRGGISVLFEEAIDAGKSLLQNEKVAIVASGNQSVEEQWLLKKMADKFKAKVFLTKNIAENDGFLVSEDRTPNRRGALLTGLVKDFDSSDISLLEAQLNAGNIKTILSMGEDLFALGLSEVALKKADILYIGTKSNKTEKEATVVFSGRTVFEKDGSFVNNQFRIQKFKQAIPGMKETTSEIDLLNALCSNDNSLIELTMEDVWADICKKCPSLSSVNYAIIPDTGLVLEASAWDSIDFPDKKIK